MPGVAEFGGGAESIVNQPPVELSCPTSTSLLPESDYTARGVQPTSLRVRDSF